MRDTVRGVSVARNSETAASGRAPAWQEYYRFNRMKLALESQEGRIPADRVRRPPDTSYNREADS